MPPNPRITPSRLDPEGLYARLGVSPSAPPEEIAAAFRQKARLLHPDVPGTGDSNAFVAVRQAYDTLHNLHRRAAYDRRARQAVVAPGQVGEIRPAPPPVMAEPPLRHPRLSDLPTFLWIGAAVVICLGLVQAVLHLSHEAASPRETMIKPVIPAPVPSNPELAAQQPSPLQLSDTPNYYIVPRAGPAILWRHEPDHADLIPGRKLPPFSTVQGLRVLRQSGMVEVLGAENETGFIEAARLAPGDASAARRAYCAYYAGVAPANGEVLERRAAGAGSLDVTNRTSQPIVMKLRDTLGGLAVSVFLAPGAQATVIGLPRGPYQPEFAVGELWSRACNSFAAGMRAQRFNTLLPLVALTPLSLPPDAGQADDIADSQFEAE